MREKQYTDLLNEYLDARDLYIAASRNTYISIVHLDELEHSMLKARDNLNEFVQKLKEK